MSSQNTNSQKKRKIRYSEDELKALLKKYEIEYSGDNEKLATDMAVRGQEALTQGNCEYAEELADLLSSLSDQWKNNFTKMKAYLLQAQISSFHNQNQLPYLEKALSSAKKVGIEDVEVGIRIQLAYEKYRYQDYKGVLKELKSIEKYPDLLSENAKIVYELKSRTYWETDDYVKGFESTLNWFNIIKDSTKDIHTLFMSIVYLLTVMSSIDLPISEDIIDKTKKDIGSLLTQLASSPHLFSQIMPSLDILFAKSLMMVEPNMLNDFAELILQTTRWNDEEKYLFICKKLSDSFYNINEIEKSKELLDKACIYVEEKKYTKIEPILKYKRAELSSLIFYFMSFDPLFDSSTINRIHVDINGETQKYSLQPLSAAVNSFPSTSYSQFLRILEKATSRYIHEDSIQIEGISEEEERSFFVLDIEIAEDRVKLLMREDFSFDIDATKTLQSMMYPYYSIIGLITEKEKKAITDIDEIENVLLKIQRGINCPASNATIYLPKGNLQMNLFKFYLQDGGFQDLKVKILDTAMSIGKEFEFAKNPDFLQIFQSDPITIFDLSLRTPEQLSPLTNIIQQAYNLNIENQEMFEFFNVLIMNFLRRSDSIFWRDFYYQFSWLQTKGIYLLLSNEELEQKKMLVKKLINFASKLDEETKILESLYYQTFLDLVDQSDDLETSLSQLTSKHKEFDNTKFMIVSNLVTELKDVQILDKDESLFGILDLFCELCEYRDWNTSLELFIYLLTKMPGLKPLFEICKKKEVKDSGLYLYLHLSKHLIKQENYDSAFQLLVWVIEILNLRKENFKFSDQIWDYLFATANQYIYSIASNISSEDMKKGNLERESLVKNLLDRYEWITEPTTLAELLVEHITILLDKSDFSEAHPHYHWIEQIMFYSWDTFTSEENSDLLKKINDLKKRIESQHFI